MIGIKTMYRLTLLLYYKSIQDMLVQEEVFSIQEGGSVNISREAYSIGTQ